MVDCKVEMAATAFHDLLHEKHTEVEAHHEGAAQYSDPQRIYLGVQ